MDNLINVDNITFEYESEDGSYEVLKDFSISFEKGTFTAVLGHNGSGKSTLAKLLNGLLLPASGNVIVNGLDTSVEENSIDIKRTVGMVFQNPDNQLVASIVEEDVAFAPENLGIERDEIIERVDYALNAVNMEEFRNHAPNMLSGGQKQRIAIAGVLAMKPEILVLDEPTAMLDPVGRQEIIKTVKRLNETENITVVLITHYMDEAAMADRIVVVDGGKVYAQGAPKEIFSKVEELKQIGLDVPQATYLAYELSKEGLNLPCGILNDEECFEEIKKCLEDE